MDLVHDIDALSDGGGGINRLIPEGANLIDAVVGCGVQFQHVQNRAVLNAHTGGAGVAGVSVIGIFAVDGPGEDLGAAGLAGASGAGEEIGMGGTAGSDLLLQGIGDMGLAHHIIKGFGPPFAVEGLIHQITRFLIKIASTRSKAAHRPLNHVICPLRGQPAQEQ